MTLLPDGLNLDPQLEPFPPSLSDLPEVTLLPDGLNLDPQLAQPLRPSIASIGAYSSPPSPPTSEFTLRGL